MIAHPLVLSGQYGSPYTLKMRAVLRYRQIPFRWVLRDSKWDDIPKPPVPIIPVIVPSDPALAFIDLLIEDYADEWLTKAMYHYRWAYDDDIDKAGHLLPISRNLQLTSDEGQRAYDFITTRQINRRELVGSTELNQPIIEGSYLRLLDILLALFSSDDFVFGDRPGRADFGLYGQLSQLTKWDPTPTAIAAKRAAKVINWVDRMDDLSWLPVHGDRGWTDLGQLPAATHLLLHEIGRTYAPFMVANAEALAEGRSEVTCDIVGPNGEAAQTYRQAPFAYQGKCLRWLREAYAALDDSDRAQVDATLAGTGCEILVR